MPHGGDAREESVALSAASQCAPGAQAFAREPQHAIA